MVLLSHHSLLLGQEIVRLLLRDYSLSLFTTVEARFNLHTFYSRPFRQP